MRAIQLKKKKRPVTRQDEQKDRNSRYYAMNDHPNYREFGPAGYTDQEGREYQVPPPKKAVSGAYLKLWVRLPPGSVWFTSTPSRRVVLHSTSDPQIPARVITIRKHFIQQGHRTGHVSVYAREWNI